MSSFPSPLLDRYQALRDAGKLDYDPAQLEALLLFQRLLDHLNDAPSFPNLFRRVMGHRGARPRGIYLYGDVGRGKSFLMDLFFAELHESRKRRTHFHRFMLEVHDRLHHLRQEGATTDAVLPRLARQMARETVVLAFDEFHVSNIADAMILGRLFTELLDSGVTIVATSNWAPDDLYKGGLQRERFLPFIALLKERLTLHYLAGPVDHRASRHREPHGYFTPLGTESAAVLRALFDSLTEGATPEAIELPVQGRILRAPLTARGVAYFTFTELCERPLAASDYLALASCFPVLLLEGVPRFQAEKRDETLRFMMLVDALYEARVKLALTADAPPEGLSPSGDMATAFRRTASRLMEMQTEAWRRLPHLG